MSHELIVTVKGQITLRQGILDHLNVRPGEKLSLSLLADGRVEIKAAATAHDISRARGLLRRPGQRPVSLARMQAAISPMA